MYAFLLEIYPGVEWLHYGVCIWAHKFSHLFQVQAEFVETEVVRGWTEDGQEIHTNTSPFTSNFWNGATICLYGIISQGIT